MTDLDAVARVRALATGQPHPDIALHSDCGSSPTLPKDSRLRKDLLAFLRVFEQVATDCATLAEERDKLQEAVKKGSARLQEQNGTLGEVDERLENLEPKIETLVDRLQEAEKDNARLEEQVAEWQASFKLYHDADMRGIDMWRAESPSERELIHPDKGNLVAWLLKKLDALDA